jgi:hypothetical protein
MKWALFTLLLLIAPALLFLVMAFMFMPAIFFAAGILYMIPKALVPAHTSETLTFIGFFGLHLLIYVGLYYLIAVAAAKLLFLIRNARARNAAFAFLFIGVVALALFPVYGSGGHGPAEWRSLPGVFQEVNNDYGPYTVAIVYGAFFLCLAALWLYRRHRRKRSS